MYDKNFIRLNLKVWDFVKTPRLTRIAVYN
jgi:hypothetical protein